jgi:hypothetical protein
MPLSDSEMTVDAFSVLGEGRQRTTHKANPATP